MNILYVSVHAILEYDEINMLMSLGHSVFPLGSYYGGRASQAFRPEIDFGPKVAEWMECFEKMGGRYSPHIPKTDYILPQAFIEMFDCCIVMHNPELFELYWESISRIPVIWRTIGVDTEGVESRMRPYREKGCKIVRYCPTEALANDYIGHDAVIRFGKNTKEFLPYGRKDNSILLFSNNFRERYPVEYDFFRGATNGFQVKLGGGGNEEFPGQIGIVSYQQQLELLSSSAVYFYGAGSFIPYTLNFMEAWLSGIPVVVLNCHSIYDQNRCKFSEIPDLIDPDGDGFIVSNVSQAQELFTELVTNPALASKIGKAGQRKAEKLFGYQVVGPQWQRLLDSV